MRWSTSTFHFNFEISNDFSATLEADKVAQSTHMENC